MPRHHVRRDLEKERKIFLISQPPDPAHHERILRERPLLSRRRALLRTRLENGEVDPVVQRRRAGLGHTFVRHENAARRFRDRADVGGKTVRPGIGRRHPAARIGELVVAVVVIDPHRHAEQRSQRFSDQVRAEQMAMHDGVAPPQEQRGQRRHVER